MDRPTQMAKALLWTRSSNGRIQKVLRSPERDHFQACLGLGSQVCHHCSLLSSGSAWLAVALQLLPSVELSLSQRGVCRTIMVAYRTSPSIAPLPT
jgi:hypothetical protein